MNTCKVVLVWVFFLIYRGDGGETFHWLQFGGFILIVIGTFVFNAERSKKTEDEIDRSTITSSDNDSYNKLNASPFDSNDDVRI